MSGQNLGSNIDPFLDDVDHATACLKAYFGTDDYTGRHFDTVGGGSLPYAVTPDDLVALALLAVPVGNRAAEALLITHASRLSELLGEIPPALCLWDHDSGVDDAIAAEGPAAQIWQILRSSEVYDFGWVSANKLLGRKRPHLLPVWDNVLNDALTPGDEPLWRPMREALRADGCRRVERLTDLRRAAGLSPALSLLRVLDAVVWMRNKGAGQVEAHRHLFDPILPAANDVNTRPGR